MKAKGNVPVSATLNGVEIPITESDYTAGEKELLNQAQKLQDMGRTAPAPQAKQTEVYGSNHVRTGPDFDKDADF